MKETKDLNSSNQKLRSAGWFAKNDKM
jgi:hypothetical protein